MSSLDALQEVKTQRELVIKNQQDVVIYLTILLEEKTTAYWDNQTDLCQRVMEEDSYS